VRPTREAILAEVARFVFEKSPKGKVMAIAAPTTVFTRRNSGYFRKAAGPSAGAPERLTGSPKIGSAQSTSVRPKDDLSEGPSTAHLN
jgi:hypothetical protein